MEFRGFIYRDIKDGGKVKLRHGTDIYSINFKVGDFKYTQKVLFTLKNGQVSEIIFI